MNRYNDVMNRHFSGLPLLGQFEDPYRQRVVSVFYIGEDDQVGMSDGTDSWVSPAASHRLDVPKLIAQHKSGTLSAKTFVQRRRVLLDNDAPVQRRALTEPAPIRRRVLND